MVLIISSWSILIVSNVQSELNTRHCCMLMIICHQSDDVCAPKWKCHIRSNTWIHQIDSFLTSEPLRLRHWNVTQVLLLFSYTTHETASENTTCPVLGQLLESYICRWGNECNVGALLLDCFISNPECFLSVASELNWQALSSVQHADSIDHADWNDYKTFL